MPECITTATSVNDFTCSSAIPAKEHVMLLAPRCSIHITAAAIGSVPICGLSATRRTFCARGRGGTVTAVLPHGPIARGRATASASSSAVHSLLSRVVRNTRPSHQKSPFNDFSPHRTHASPHSFFFLPPFIPCSGCLPFFFTPFARVRVCSQEAGGYELNLFDGDIDPLLRLPQTSLQDTNTRANEIILSVAKLFLSLLVSEHQKSKFYPFSLSCPFLALPSRPRVAYLQHTSPRQLPTGNSFPPHFAIFSVCFRIVNRTTKKQPVEFKKIERTAARSYACWTFAVTKTTRNQKSNSVFFCSFASGMPYACLDFLSLVLQTCIFLR